MTSSSNEGGTQTGKAEVGINKERSEVFLDYAGSRAYMQPDEARQFAELLLMSADSAEGAADD